MQLDVRWPMVSLSIEPQEIETYPDANVTASVMFQASYCQAALGSLIPETWISLIYCGHSPSDCKLDNVSHLSQVRVYRKINHPYIESDSHNLCLHPFAISSGLFFLFLSCCENRKRHANKISNRTRVVFGKDVLDKRNKSVVEIYTEDYSGYFQTMA